MPYRFRVLLQRSCSSRTRTRFGNKLAKLTKIETFGSELYSVLNKQFYTVV